MKKLSIFIFLLPFIFQQCYSQNKMKFEDLIKLDRDSMIQIAIKQIGIDVFEGINPIEHKYIVVKVCENKIWVSFKNPVLFLKKNEAFYSEIGIELTEGITSMSRISNPENFKSTDDIQFYREKEEDIKKIDFVISILKKHPELIVYKDFYYINSGFIIRENKKHYEIHNFSEAAESYLKIKKRSGEIFDIIGYSIEPDPEEVNIDCREIN